MKPVPALLALVVVLGGVLTARQDARGVPFTDAAPLFDAIREDLWPADFQGRPRPEVEAAWPAWVARHDAAVRARVAQGDADSIVHLLLFGTSFTTRPRASAADLAGLAQRPADAVAALRPRIDAFVAALAAPGADERLAIARDVLARNGVDLTAAGGAQAAARYLEARLADIGRAGTDQLAALARETTDTIFRTRGLSSDTTISVNFGVERAIQDLADQRLLQPGSVRRVAIIGPGLEIADKQQGFDFYPLQTIQPFAVIDSLLRFGVADPSTLQVTAFDVSPRVIGHLEAARARARAGQPYTLVLPRDEARTWDPALADYWERLGNWIGTPLTAAVPRPPASAGRVQVRAIAVRPEVVLAVTPRDLDIVTHTAQVDDDSQRFDLVLATNILLYYDVFEQSLALGNVARLLQPGGVFLANSRLIELPAAPLTAAGVTETTYMTLPGVGAAGDRVFWYRRP